MLSTKLLKLKVKENKKKREKRKTKFACTQRRNTELENNKATSSYYYTGLHFTKCKKSNRKKVSQHLVCTVKRNNKYSLPIVNYSLGPKFTSLCLTKTRANAQWKTFKMEKLILFKVSGDRENGLVTKNSEHVHVKLDRSDTVSNILLTLTAPTSPKCDNRAQPRRRQKATSVVREETTA